MNTGRVKWFDRKKGYGFITGDNGEEYFVHWSGIESDKRFKCLWKNQKVTFDVKTDNSKKTPIAVNVKR